MKRRKKKTGILPLLALAAVLFTACAADTDRQNPKQNPDTAGLTAFVMEDSTDSPETRLAGEYTGSGVDFYWSDDDRLFLNAPVDNPPREWLIDKWNNIHELARTNSGGPGRTPSAKFWFEG